MSQALHLVKRFFWSLRASEPDPAGEQWLLGYLNPAEADLYRRMSVVDRRHAVRAAHAVADLGDVVVVAAALHDVGKTEAGLGTFGRVAATLAGAIPRARRGRVALYLDHPAIGARLLHEAGSAPFVVAWTLEHHMEPEEWAVPEELGRRLVAADG